METTRNKLPEKTEYILNKLSEYLDTKLYFFGSVQRLDYFPGKSDIDIDLFSDNVDMTMYKLAYFFRVDKHEFKKVVMRIKDNNHIIHGHKIVIERPQDQFQCEFLVFHDKYKEDVLHDSIKKIDLGYWQLFILYFLKLFYYQWGIIPKKWYKNCKRFIINRTDSEFNDEFLTFDGD